MIYAEARYTNATVVNSDEEANYKGREYSLYSWVKNCRLSTNKNVWF